MSKVIVRMIHGVKRLIHVDTDLGSRLHQTIRAYTVDGTGKKIEVAKAMLSTPPGVSHATLVHVKTHDEFKQKGFARELVNTAMESLGSRGKKFLRTDEIIHPGTAKILARKQTKFFGTGLGINGNKTKMITTKRAEQGAKKIHKGTNTRSTDPKKIFSTTMIPKRLRRIK